MSNPEQYKHFVFVLLLPSVSQQSVRTFKNADSNDNSKRSTGIVMLANSSSSGDNDCDDGKSQHFGSYLIVNHSSSKNDVIDNYNSDGLLVIDCVGR